MSDDAERLVLDAWQANAQPWTTAVREQVIASRRLATDRAVIDAVLESAPRRVLDIGCGEGWLARALAAHRIAVLGVDAVPELVMQATAAGGGEFRVLDYAALAGDALAGEEFDLAVANFSLLGESSVNELFGALPRLLAVGGRLVVQTLHPAFVLDDTRYEDGWRPGSWAHIEGDFGTPAPWYLRTVGSWLALLAASGFELLALREPLHPQSGLPASLLLIAQRRD